MHTAHTERAVDPREAIDRDRTPKVDFAREQGRHKRAVAWLNQQVAESELVAGTRKSWPLRPIRPHRVQQPNREASPRLQARPQLSSLPAELRCAPWQHMTHIRVTSEQAADFLDELISTPAPTPRIDGEPRPCAPVPAAVECHIAYLTVGTGSISEKNSSAIPGIE